jgi:hypothetical protein
MRAFICNVCLAENNCEESILHREIESCSLCRSTVRIREIIEVFESISNSKKLKVLGLSDHNIISDYMEKHGIYYINTFLEKDPQLDISKPNQKYIKYADVLISSDVLEHVMPPFEEYVKGHFDVLKKGGKLIMTTPYFHHKAYIEKYPLMSSYSVDDFGKVVASDKDGKTFDVNDAIFHGGPGNTLEMRLFSPEILKYTLEQVGFIDIQMIEEDNLEYGILRSATNMGTFLATKP